MDWPISQRITDPRAASQQEAGHALSRHVPCGDHVGTKVTENGLVILATSEIELEKAAYAVQQAVPGLRLWKPQLNYIFGNPLLEPYAVVLVKVPKELGPQVLNDLHFRRAELKSETESNGLVSIEAEVPMSELLGYSTMLHLISRSSGSFKQNFSGYRPGPVADDTDYVAV